MQISDKEKYRQNLQTKFANRAGLALFSNLWCSLRILQKSSRGTSFMHVISDVIRKCTHTYTHVYANQVG